VDVRDLRELHIGVCRFCGARNQYEAKRMTLPKETTMIEKAARAFLEALPDDEFYARPGEDPRCCTIDGCGDITSAIRAVVTALRDPTPEMIAAGMIGLSNAGVDSACVGDARMCWQAMIDRTLSDGEG
jgi:hypothetical protein